MRNVAVFFAISIAVLLWLSRGDAAPQADPPTLRPLSSIAEELKKDGTFSEEDAKTIALEVARRIWFPEPRRLKIASEPEESGGWTVRCFEWPRQVCHQVCQCTCDRPYFRRHLRCVQYHKGQSRVF